VGGRRRPSHTRTRRLVKSSSLQLGGVAWRGRVLREACIGRGRGSVLVASVHCNDMVELGARLGALLIALEHRFYGRSMPYKDYSTQSLR
jgi:hypothetical protein